MSEGRLAALPIERLEAAITSLASELAARLERWLALVAEFDRRGGARRWGFRGTAEWLAWRCGLSQRTARDHVRVARALVERPLVREGLARGETVVFAGFGRWRGRRPGRTRPAWSRSPVSPRPGELERVVRGLRSAPSAGLDAAQHAHARRFLDWWWESDSSLSLRGRLPAEHGAAFIEMIETAAAVMHAPPVPEATAPALAEDPPPLEDASTDGDPDELAGDPPQRPPVGARRADALTEIAHSGSPRTQVVLHVDEAALACTATVASDRAG